MAATHLIGVSIPRAGHHFLAELLRHVLGTGFAYCEFYGPDDCCRSVPCRKVPDVRLFLQKNHDLDLSLPAHLEGVTYVVQYRDPVMSALSDREHIAFLESEARAGDREEFPVWLGRKAAYYERFFEKWIRQPERNRIVVDYDDLVDDTAKVLERVLSGCGVAVGREAIRAACVAASGVTAAYPAGSKSEFFRRRTLEESRFQDPSVLPVFESLVLDRLPELRSKRRLEIVDWDDHPVAHVYRAEMARASGEPERALSFVGEALKAAPANRHLLAMKSDLLSTLSRTGEAIEAAVLALEQKRDDPEALRRLSDLYYVESRETLAKAREVAEHLVRLFPQDMGHRLHLATILLRLQEIGAAQEHAIKVIQIGSRDSYVWRMASDIFMAGKSWPSALAAVDGAITLRPREAEYHHHRANILAILGRIDEAELAHRRAIELDANQPDWWWKLSEDLRIANRAQAASRVVQEALSQFPEHSSLKAQARQLSKSLAV